MISLGEISNQFIPLKEIKQPDASHVCATPAADLKLGEPMHDRHNPANHPNRGNSPDALPGETAGLDR
jgi:hypothetical protein